MSKLRALKTIGFTAQSSQHHLAVKIRSVVKWLKSGHEVKVAITGKADRHKAIESVYEQLEREVKAGAEVTQKAIKADSIKFYLKPTVGATNLKVKEDDPGNDDITVENAAVNMFSDDFDKQLEEEIKREENKSKKH